MDRSFRSAVARAEARGTGVEDRRPEIPSYRNASIERTGPRPPVRDSTVSTRIEWVEKTECPVSAHSCAADLIRCCNSAADRGATGLGRVPVSGIGVGARGPVMRSGVEINGDHEGSSGIEIIDPVSSERILRPTRYGCRNHRSQLHIHRFYHTTMVGSRYAKGNRT